ncbi:unnamed protein product [Cyclocybe aegerita]|uniref:Uncharacterized protein n=1 Tax=Cyclocybe aegerita TaxID=1973307 RepID=A0A8S0WJ86_CYCAE|nr:unnamed protein product [Cyclocybe aegerita]
MKNFDIVAILFVLASAIVPSLAVPLPSLDAASYFAIVTERDDFVLVSVLEACAISVSAQDTVTWLSNDANSGTINAKPICFYSGHTVVMNTKIKKLVTITAHSKLSSFMSTHGIDNIVHTAGHSKDARHWTTVDWEAVSKALTQHITGTVRVLLGTAVPDNSIWSRAEKPALMSNATVLIVEHYQIDTKDGIIKKANIKG